MRTVALALLLLILPLAQSPARAQTTEAAIKARLMDQPLFLRGFWRDNDLSFDSNGQLKGRSDPVSFTLSGFVLKEISLTSNQLVLTGPRVVIEFRDNGKKTMRVPVSGAGGPFSRKIPEIKITISAPPNGDYTKALDAIFANGLAEIVPLLPYYWKSYATENFLPASVTDDAAPPAPAAAPLSGDEPLNILKAPGITPPKLLHSVEPKYSQAARALDYSGTVVVNLWLTPEGKASHLSILIPAGAGLDEEAMAAVAQYTFIPAMQNGKPVLVELNISIHFDAR